MGFWFAYMGIEGGGAEVGGAPTIPGMEYAGPGPMHYNSDGPMHYESEDE